MSEDNLTQDGLEAIAADILNGSVDSPDADASIPNPDQGFLDIANDMLGVADNASDQESSESEDDTVSDNEEETLVESDDDTPVEAEADEEDGEEPTDDVDEYFEVAYDDAKDGVYPIKINGEVKMMKFGEIQNQLARSESASKKSQEANQRQEELEAREVKLAEAEAFATQRMEAANSSAELGQIGAYIQGQQAAYAKATEAQDSHQMIMIDANIKKAQTAYQQTADKVTKVQQETQARHTQAQQEILKEKGYGDIISDVFRDYATTNLSDQAIQALNTDATLVILAEKARKWDASQGKGKRTLKKSKSLRTGGGNVKQAQTNKQQKIKQQMAAGQGNPNDAEAALLNIANDMLGLN